MNIERMQLRRLEAIDLALRVEWLNHPLVSPYLNTGEYFSIENTMCWYERIREDNTRFDVVFCVDNVVVGMGGLTHISSVNRNAEVYIYLNPSVHGHGLGRMAMHLLCQEGFLRLDLVKIYAYTFKSNERANQMFSKVGFVREGVLRQHSLKDGMLKDRCFWGLLKDEF
ncbi:GNAT family N-acetyltransferase [Butyricimonas hominis]|jgi:putative GCN5-related N-acetyltransferase|uniref:GNAT family N-acetyltransferase n=1 Tax=Butyricimonas hominis TaxID=2763032 RepID=A0ABR7D3B4_9BACT|nr:GNAT family protein [Butyricimonas hominis]MBC5622421.1 GNAT family N-acetyltransferase [Butyricimonas hominis]